MKKYIRIFSLLMCAVILITCFFGCSKEVESTPVKAQDFRITAYVVSSSIDENFDFSHFDQLTDIILFGNANFDESGKSDHNRGLPETDGERTGKMSGRITFVGAGPGAVDLITLRGAAALDEADLVIYDEPRNILPELGY